jgi:membrane associated rhomboid family serine protease
MVLHSIDKKNHTHNRNMGLEDRDYMQDGFTGGKRIRPRRTNGWSAVMIIIAINFALWFANGLLFENNELTNALLLQQHLGDAKNASSFLNPATCYRYVTCGFVHSPQDIWHILFNMLGLLMFGYGMMLGIGPGGIGLIRGENVENRLGRLEFTAFYLLTIIVGGVVYALINIDAKNAGVLGASGGVSGVVILYAWFYPRKTLLFWGILPMPMWAIGVLIVAMDASGAAGTLGGNIAYSVHLAGAALGTLYYLLFFRQGIRLTGWLDASSRRPRRKTKLHVHVPEDSPQKSPLTDDDFNRRLDEILQRYGEVGESGLTAEEREFLRRASKRLKKKHRSVR